MREKGLSLASSLLRLLEKKMLRAFFSSLHYATIHAHVASQLFGHEDTGHFIYQSKMRPDGSHFTLVREKGLEPSRPKAHAPKACVSTNSTTRAQIWYALL